MAPEPARGLSASHAARTTAARVEFEQWQRDHPDFDTRTLLDNWRRIRQGWGLTHDQTPPPPKGKPA